MSTSGCTAAFMHMWTEHRESFLGFYKIASPEAREMVVTSARDLLKVKSRDRRKGYVYIYV